MITENRKQNTEYRSQNSEPQTAAHATTDHRCHKWMGGLNPARQLFQNPVHSQLRQLFH